MAVGAPWGGGQPTNEFSSNVPPKRLMSAICGLCTCSEQPLQRHWVHLTGGVGGRMVPCGTGTALSMQRHALLVMEPSLMPCVESTKSNGTGRSPREHIVLTWHPPNNKEHTIKSQHTSFRNPSQCRQPKAEAVFSLKTKGAFSHSARTVPITTLFIPGTPPENHPPTEACMINSKQHRGCRIQDPGTRGYLRWKKADFSHSAGTAHGAPPKTSPA